MYGWSLGSARTGGLRDASRTDGVGSAQIRIAGPNMSEYKRCVAAFRGKDLRQSYASKDMCGKRRTRTLYNSG